MGPIAFKDHFEEVKKYVEIGKKDGSTLTYGWTPPEEDLRSDLFFLPTIFTDVDKSLGWLKKKCSDPF